jgi:hypothetical protein
LHHADPAASGVPAVRPQLHHAEAEALLARLRHSQALGQQGLDHVVEVGLQVSSTLFAQTQRQIEHHVAGALVAQLKAKG